MAPRYYGISAPIDFFSRRHPQWKTLRIRKRNGHIVTVPATKRRIPKGEVLRR